MLKDPKWRSFRKQSRDWLLTWAEIWLWQYDEHFCRILSWFSLVLSAINCKNQNRNFIQALQSEIRSPLLLPFFRATVEEDRKMRSWLAKLWWLTVNGIPFTHEVPVLLLLQCERLSLVVEVQGLTVYFSRLADELADRHWRITIA